MLKSLTKIILGGATTAIAGTGVIVPTTTYVIQQNKTVENNEQDWKYVYLPSASGSLIRVGKTIDEVTEKILTHELTHIRNTSFAGDFFRATNTNNMVNTSLLHELSSNTKYQYGYKMANGKYTLDKDQALKSYVQNVSYNYRDLNGDLHTSLVKAQDVNNQISAARDYMGVSFYNIFDSSNGITYKINPLNKKDINYFKEIALRNLTTNGSNFSLVPVYENKDASGNGNIANAEDIFYIENSKENVVNAVFEILSLLSDTKDNNFKYNFTVGLSNNNPVTRSTGWMGRWGSTWIPEEKTDDKYQRDFQVLSYRIEGNNTFSDLSAEDFEKYAGVFTNQEKFKEATKWSGPIIHRYWWSFFDGAMGQNCTETADAYDYSVEVGGRTIRFTHGRDLSGSNNESVRYKFTDRMRLNSVSNQSQKMVTTNVAVTTNMTSINKDDLVNKITDILLNNIALKEIDKSYLLSNQDVIDELTKSMKNKAKEIVEAFYQSAKGVYVGMNQSVSSVSGSINSMFKNADSLSYLNKESKLNDASSTWWVKNLYNSGIFQSLSSISIDTRNKVDTILSKFSYMISYNNVPTFMIDDVRKINSSITSNMTKNEVANALKKWALSPGFDASLLTNISEKISYDAKIKSFVYNPNAKNMTSKDNPIQNIDKFKVDMFDEELAQSQNLVQIGGTVGWNDRGVESSMYLYNKNLNSIVNNFGSSYIGAIDKESFSDFEVLRLYKDPNMYHYSKSEFLNYKLPVYYGEVKSYNGVFNPSVNSREIYIYENDKKLSIPNTSPVSVPVADINGRTYQLSQIVNGKDGIITGTLEQIEDNLYRYLKQFLDYDRDYIYVDNTWVVNEIKTLVVLDISKSTSKYASYIFGDKNIAFLTYNDAVEYLRAIVTRAAVLK